MKWKAKEGYIEFVDGFQDVHGVLDEAAEDT